MTHPALAPLLERLARLRARVRRLLAISGTAQVVVWAAGIAGVWFLADYLLDLPVGVRRFVRLGLLDRPAGLSFGLYAALLAMSAFGLYAGVRRRSGVAGFFAFSTAGVLGLLVWVFVRRLASPLRVRLSDETLALSVEERQKKWNDRLAAALDFDQELAAPSRGESTGMMTRVLEDASREAQGIEFAGVASGRHARRLVGLAALAVAAVATLFAAMPATAALWFRRSLTLEDVSWPQTTTLVAIVRGPDGGESDKDATVPYTAALGQPLTVYARAIGRVPSEVEIVDRVLDEGAGGRPLAHRMRAVAEHEGLFEYEFRDVRGDFEFAFRGGDDRDELPAYRVAVRVPPRITGLQCDLVFPAYLSLPPRRVEGGTLAVPEGTEISIAFSCDVPAARAEAFVDEKSVTLEPNATRTGFSFRFTPVKTVRYRLRIVTADGRENDPAVDTYEVTVDPDTPPRAEWVWPRAPVEVTAKGQVPLFAQTHDDHGIVALALEVAASGATAPLRIPLAPRTEANPSGANDRPYGGDAVLTYLPLEVSSVLDKEGKPLAAPTRFQARLVAKDSKGQESAGPWTPVDVLRPDEIERGFAGQRATVKAEVEAIRTEVRGMRETVAGLASPGAAIGEAERQVLRDLQFKQGKVRGDVDKAVRTIGSLFTTYVYDRLGAEVPTARLLSLFDRRHRAAFSRSTDLKGDGTRTTDPAAGPDAGDGVENDVFPRTLFREVVAARRDRVVFDTGVLDKMITVLEHAVSAADVRAPAAQEAAATASRTGTPADVAALLAEEDRLLASLDTLYRAMAEWQSLSELTLFLRRLIEEQETIRDDIKGLNKKDR